MVMKHYSPEFRAEAVALYRSRPGTTVAAVARDLGINIETLRSWIRADQARGADAETAAPADTHPVPGSLEAENAALCRKVRESGEEREIPRKAAKYFAGQTRW
ncbi:transposase [Kutzneria sp. CA-103260]|uniref:transposase n=1 Tax=Kutzneria sp. CA-103260 TaxID=2802641 RepID=UPI001BAD642A|nr:transposase [Kutzneria sp. CA-103260]QUQ65265.1 IS3 family transposase [Kutzneria sp. CA-103260]